MQMAFAQNVIQLKAIIFVAAWFSQHYPLK
jgi:hypothetical protein